MTIYPECNTWCHHLGIADYNGGRCMNWKLLNNKEYCNQMVIAAVYHGIGGISLGIFFVLHGALKLLAQFLPKIPPRMVRGKPTETKQNNNKNK